MEENSDNWKLEKKLKQRKKRQSSPDICEISQKRCQMSMECRIWEKRSYDVEVSAHSQLQLSTDSVMQNMRILYEHFISKIKYTTGHFEHAKFFPWERQSHVWL